MDLGEWHGSQSSFRSDLLGPAAQAAALQADYPLLPRAGDGGESLYRNGLLLVFRRFQLWRLGGGDSGLTTTLDLADWARCVWCGFVLCIYAGGGRQAEAISKQQG